MDAADVSAACILCLGHRRTRDPEEERRRKRLEWKREMEERRVDNTVWDGTRMDSAELESRVRSAERADNTAEEKVDIAEGRRIEIREDDGPQYSIKAELRSGKAGFKESDGDPEEDADITGVMKTAFAEIDLLNAEDSNGIRSGDEVAKRAHRETVGGRGKYIRSRETNGPVRDIAFD